MKISDDAMHHRAFVERVTAQCARIAHCGGLSIALVGAASAASSSLGSSQSFRRRSRLKPLLQQPFHRIGLSPLCYSAATPPGVAYPPEYPARPPRRPALESRRKTEE